MVIVEPSTQRTRRPCQSQSSGAALSPCRPVSRTNVKHASSGIFSRAVQQAPVSAEHGFCPHDNRQAMSRATASVYE